MLSNKLIFVYNADSDVFSQMSDFAHKLISPKTYKCNLCAITHGNFAEKKEWTDFIKTLTLPVAFLHRDEFVKQYGRKFETYPLVLLSEDGQLNEFINSESISRCKNIDDLKNLIQNKIQKIPARSN